MDRIPVEFSELLDRLRGKFRRGEVEENIGTGGLDHNDLRVHRWCAGFMRRTGNNHPVVIISQTVLQPQKIVLSKIVVLVEHADLGVRMMLKNIGCVDPRFSAIVRCKPIVQGKCSGSPQREAPLNTNS